LPDQVLRRSIATACVLASVGTGVGDAVRDPSACAGRCPRAIAYSLDPRFDADERRLIEDAMHLWERGTGERVCFAGGGLDLVIDKLDRPEQLEPWDPEWRRHVALTKGGRIWIVADRLADAGEYRALVVHELGHYLGVGHIEDTTATYMHSAINDTPGELRVHPRLPIRDARAFCQAQRCTCAQ
jgi:hypothetical protein